jgi:hypothetical protein
MATNQVARSGNFPGGMNFLMTYHQGNVQMENHTYCQKLKDGRCGKYGKTKRSALDLVNNSMSECWREFDSTYGGALNIFREGVYSSDDWGIMNMCSKGSLSGFFARYLGLGGLIVPGDLQLGTSNGMLTAWQQLGFSAGLDISTHADGYQYGFPVAFDGAYIDNNAIMASLLALEFLVAPHQRWCYCSKLKQWYGVYDPACDVVQRVTKAVEVISSGHGKDAFCHGPEFNPSMCYGGYYERRAASPPTTESALLEWAAPVPGVDYMFSLVSTGFPLRFLVPESRRNNAYLQARDCSGLRPPMAHLHQRLEEYGFEKGWLLLPLVRHRLFATRLFQGGTGFPYDQQRPKAKVSNPAQQCFRVRKRERY